MRLLSLLLLIFFFWFTEANGAAPDHATERNILRGIELLYDGETDAAEALFSDMVRRRPKDPAGRFYMAMVTWSKLTTGFWSREVVGEYIERIDRTISVAKAEIEDGKPDAYTYFYLGGALGFKGRFFLMERKWLSSFSLASEAIEALKQCRSLDPSNMDVLLGLGIFDYYTAKMSGILKFLTFLLLHRGDREEGLRKLHQAAQEARLSSIEAKSVLLHIYLYLEDDRTKALQLAKELAGRFKGSRFLRYLEGLAYLRLDMDGEVQRIAADMMAMGGKEPSRSKAALWTRQSLYLESSRALFRGNYLEARQKLDQILSMQDPGNDPLMIAYPLLKKGVSYDLEGDRETALGFYGRVMDMENGAGAQFLAEKFVKAPANRKDPFLGY
jgi:hypothetical protein